MLTMPVTARPGFRRRSIPRRFYFQRNGSSWGVVASESEVQVTLSANRRTFSVQVGELGS